MSNSDIAQVSSLPLPPVQYINQYTDENIRRGRAPRPPPLIHDTYSMFGNAYNTDDTIIRPLESQGIKRLYPQHFDRRRELRKLNHSLLVNFLDLLDLLVQCPDSPRRAEKVEDLTLLFIHIHHLLNEFRPHQARETLRVMMEVQKRQRNETAQRFQKHLDKNPPAGRLLSCKSTASVICFTWVHHLDENIDIYLHYFVTVNEEVREILQQALQNLPDSSEMDTKLLVPTELFEDMDTSTQDDAGNEACNILDRLMCTIVDAM